MTFPGYLKTELLMKIFTLLVVALLAQPAQSSGEDQAHFLTGIKSYQEGQYEKAVESFKQSLEVAPNNPITLYNYARTLYQQEAWGLALAMARKSLTLDPNLNEAKRIIPFLESKLSITSERHFKQFPEFLENALIRLPLWGIAALNMIFLVIFFRFLFKFLGERRQSLLEDLPLPKITTSLICLFIIAVLSSGLIISKGIYEMSSYATVISEKAELKSGPEDTEATLIEVNSGLELQVMKTYDTWYQVSLAGELVGWIKGESIFITKEGF